MIDIGVNLHSDQFDADRAAVLERAWAAGVEQLILTGTDLASSRAAASAAAGADDGRLSATAGIHPHDAARVPTGWIDTLRALAGEPRVVAIGETGLDFNRNFSPPESQRQVFREQLALARELDLPVFVHDREAGEEVAAALREVLGDGRRSVVHCFTGGRDELIRYLDLGCHIGITGWVCDRRRGGPLRELVPVIPLDRLMIETDAPYLRPHNAPAATGRNRHRNEPALLGWVASQLAGLYGVDPVTLQQTTAANARRFFGLDG